MVNQSTRRDDPYQRILARWLEEDVEKADYADQCRKLLEPAIADGWNATFFPYRAERVYGNLRFLLDVVPGSHWVYGLAVYSRLNVSSLSCGRDSVLQPLMDRAAFIADQLDQNAEGEETEGEETVERIDFLANVIITAVEGGINYWTEYGDYQYTENKDGLTTDASVELREYQVVQGMLNEHRTLHKVTLATIRKGIQKVQEPDFQINPVLLNFILAADRDNDGENIDSEAADCIVQAALFGELVYG